MIICYTVPEIWRQVSDVIAIFHFEQFLALLPTRSPDSPKNENLKKMKKKTNKQKTPPKEHVEVSAFTTTVPKIHVLYCS